MKYNLKVSFHLIFAILTFNFGCESEEPEQPENNSLNINQNFSVMASDGQSWSSDSVILFDRTNNYFQITSESFNGAYFDINYSIFSGLGTFSFNQMEGSWSYSPGGQNNIFYSNFIAAEGDFGTISFTEHDFVSNKLTGSFDFILPNVSNGEVFISVQGTFVDIPIIPFYPIDGQASVEINDEIFSHDYIQTTNFDGNEINVVLTKDIQEMVIIQFERFGIQENTTYLVSETEFCSLEYENAQNRFYNQMSGTFTVDTHQPGSTFNDIPGFTAGNFDVVVGNYNMTDSITISGNFSVNYD